MAPSETRIDELRRRVREEPESRAFVLLAEEYRRDDRIGEALSTLEAGLAVQPDYLAARIALGRYQLEAFLADEGIRSLEQVVEADETQMVAYRLLIGAYAERGDSAAAQRALKVYTLLNPQDTEIQFLEDLAGAAQALPAGDDRSATYPPSPDSEPTAPAEAAPAERPPESRQSPFSLAPPEVMAPELGSLEPRPLRRPRAPGGAEDEKVSPQLDRGREESRESSAAPRATATLAELYLRQGHTEEAAEIYRRVLADDPGNSVARAALRALASSPPKRPRTGAGSSAQDMSTSPAKTNLELYRSYAARLAALREERDARA